MALTDVTSTPLPRLAERPLDSHKGLYGHVLLVGGSRGMSGSISLSGLACLRSGAGLVTVVVPGAIQNVVAGFDPSYMTHGIAASEYFAAAAADEVLALAENMTVVALGPGLGRAAETVEFVARLYREIKRPMVVDADALFALAERRDLLKQVAGPRILTPHPGEFARLTGAKPANDDQARSLAAGELASASGRGTGIVVVLKGHHTVITDGARFALNQTGNPGMATGGTGDVLTGVIAALAGQGLNPFDAARLGVHLHGRAGDLAAEKFGQISLIAGDLIDYLPAAFRQASR